MKTIRAKFNCRCSETNAIIKKGEQCLYDSTAKKVVAISGIQSDESKLVQAQEEAYFDNFCNQNYI